jgi:uncharacterized SAM-binding protein YcdF (DUF218 family)
MAMRFFHPLVDPIGLLWLVLLSAAGWHLWKKQWRAAIAPVAGALLTWLMGNTWVSSGLLASLERPYAGKSLAQVQPADAVIVLGGWATPSRWAVYGAEFGGAVDRLLVAVELMRQGKAPALVLAGGKATHDGQIIPENQPVQAWLRAWKVVPQPIHCLPPCANTREEALQAGAWARTNGWRRVILVTSAAHLKRASAAFRKAGVEVEPVGADFVGMTRLDAERAFQPLPQWEDFEALGSYLREVVGGWVYRWRGWL